jgi:predicted RNA binding protein YcfA (HicA-like mRNA interferase family)
MKKQKLIKELKAKGASFVGHGANHEIWESRNGYKFTVPRHTEIKEGLAKTILKQAEK